MVHPSVAGAAAATNSRHSLRPPMRLASSGSFHAGAPIPNLSPYREAPRSAQSRRSLLSPTLRRQSTHKYHTFPTPPPKTPSDTNESGPVSPGSGASGTQYGHRHGGNNSGGSGDRDATPLPWKQLGLLALLSLSEQTALNSIGPYLPSMVGSFHELPSGETGLYVGLLASAFALAQLTTNFLWGYLSDTVGRKPVMLAGTLLLAGCFTVFGFCTSYAQLVAVHVAMGLLNGNAAVVPTCLGEVTDRSNQSRAFTWLPIIYSLGGITGPALGGLLAGDDDAAYPFLVPNILSAALLFASVVVVMIWFEETLDGADQKAAGAGLGWLERICDCGRLRRRKSGRSGSWSSRWPRRGQNVLPANYEEDQSSDADDETGDEQQDLSPLPDVEADGATADDSNALSRKSALRQLVNRTTLTVLATYLVFQLSNISFNSLYPIFASAAPPTGRALSPGTIGLSLSFAGLATVLFQAFAFQPLKARLGNLGSYRAAMLGIAACMALIPWIGYVDDDKPPSVHSLGPGKLWLYSELGAILVAKNIFAVGGLSSVMLLLTNSAPTHETLGTLNGIAQTLSAAGRSIGPFLSGGLFTLSTHVKPKGELLAWGLFAGIAFLGWLGTLLIRGQGLESEDWMGQDEDGGEEDEGAEADEEDEEEV